MELMVSRYFKPDRKPGRPSKKYKELTPSDARSPEKEYAKIRKAQKQASETHYTLEQWSSLVAEYGRQCLCCLKSSIKLTADHVIPLSRGGSDGIENIQPLCGRCNPSKGTRIIDYRPGFAFEII